MFVTGRYKRSSLRIPSQLELEFVLQDLPGAVTAVTGMGGPHGAVRGCFLADQKGGAAVADVLLGEEGEGDGQRG